MFLGTSLYDAPVLSIVTGLLGIVLFVLYQRAVKKARANGEGYDGPEVEELIWTSRICPALLPL